MKFGFEQTWEADPDDVLAVYIDGDFWSSLTHLTKTSPPDVLEVTRSAETAVVRLRYVLSVDLPKEAGRFIDPDDVAWVEETTWRLADRTAAVRFLHEQASALMKASAAANLQGVGGTTTREIVGDLKVRIPLLGGRVEKAIVDGIGDHLEEEADAVADRLG